MARTLGIMLTMTTYGTWLRGNQRGWVDEGRISPPDPNLESTDLARLKHSPYQFDLHRLIEIGSYTGSALTEKLKVIVWALTVQTWHVHVVIRATEHGIPDVVKCFKETVRRGLKERRPIWTDGYDKRFCFSEEAVWTRIRYVERHNLECGLSARPWSFITNPI